MDIVLLQTTQERIPFGLFTKFGFRIGKLNFLLQPKKRRKKVKSNVDFLRNSSDKLIYNVKAFSCEVTIFALVKNNKDGKKIKLKK